MENKVDQFIESHHLFQVGQTVVLGVSGGPDSIALLHFLNQRKQAYNLNLICCSVDHGLRGNVSVEDVEFVGELARKWEIPFEGVSVDVLARIQEKGVGTQEAARDLRFEVFQNVLKTHQATDLVLAHHGDDQVETMLMQHVRGGFGSSLAGMPVIRHMEWGRILRPFLCVTKEELIDYCRRHDLPFRVDESNQSEKYTRNRFRHHVLPFLKDENPQVHTRFQQQSEWIYDEDYFMNQVAEEKLKELTHQKTEGQYTLVKRSFLQVPVPLQRRILHLILNYVYKSKGWKPQHQTIHIDLVLTWLKRLIGPGEWLLPGGFTVNVHGEYMAVRQPHVSVGREGVNFKNLPIPGHLSSNIGDFIIEKSQTWDSGSQDQTVFFADSMALNLPLNIRSYQAGDRMRLLGQEGTKKVSRLFIDHKIPQEWRPNWPILVDDVGTILWVPLLKRSDQAVCTAKTSTFIKILFRPSKDFGRIM